MACQRLNSFVIEPALASMYKLRGTLEIIPVYFMTKPTVVRPASATPAPSCDSPDRDHRIISLHVAYSSRSMHIRELPSPRVLVRPAHALSSLPCLHGGGKWVHGSSFNYRSTPLEHPRFTSECCAISTSCPRAEVFRWTRLGSIAAQV